MENSPRIRWRELALQVVLSIISAFLGAFFATGGDYFKKMFAETDVKAYLLDLTAMESRLSFRFALVNAGYRQGLVSELTVLFPLWSNGYRGEMSPPSSEFTLQEIPNVLGPGDIRLITIVGTVPIQGFYFHAASVNPETDGQAYAGKDVRRVPVILRIRAIDFKGRKYEARWEVCKLYVNPENIAGWRRGDEQFSVFNKRFLSPDKEWLSIERLGQTS
jgi:hypothetical protein